MLSLIPLLDFLNPILGNAFSALDPIIRNVFYSPDLMMGNAFYSLKGIIWKYVNM